MVIEDDGEFCLSVCMRINRRLEGLATVAKEKCGVSVCTN